MRPQGFKAFVIVWSGQIVSILASGMTGFALSIWTFQKTGSVTAMGAVQVFYLVPFLLVSPLAGALIDRHSRKLMMATSDLVAVVGTAFIMAMNAFGHLELWHLFLAASLNGLGNSFQWPAYSAAVSVMLPKEQYSRANGMLGLMESAPNILAPILAGTILPLIGLGGILAVDLASFFVALLALSTVSIPNPPRTAEGQASKGSLFRLRVQVHLCPARPQKPPAGVPWHQSVLVNGDYAHCPYGTGQDGYRCCFTGNSAGLHVSRRCRRRHHHERLERL